VGVYVGVKGVCECVGVKGVCECVPYLFVEC
jgi:hypothetical protein